MEEIAERTREAWQRGATEVCLQGGIHPQYTGNTYLEIVAAVKDAVPDMHVHAFSPLEIAHGAASLGRPGRLSQGEEDAVRRAIEKFESNLLQGHLNSCVPEGFREGREQEMIAELAELFELAQR